MKKPTEQNTPAVIASEKDSVKDFEELGHRLWLSYVDQHPKLFEQDGQVYRDLRPSKTEIKEQKNRLSEYHLMRGKESVMHSTMLQTIDDCVEASLRDYGMIEGVNCSTEEFEEYRDHILRTYFRDIVL